VKKLLVAALCAGCASPGPAATSLTKGPWVESVDETRASLRWESRTADAVEAALTVEGAANAERRISGRATETHVVSSWGVGMVPHPDFPGIYYRNDVQLTGLAPGTCYAWLVRASGTDAMKAGDQRGRFCTARAPGSTFTFHAIGDTNPILGHTVPTLKQTLAHAPDFSLHLGDMQYYSSIAETWAYWFNAMSPLLRAGALFPTVGNHENENNGLEFDDYYARLFIPASADASMLKWYRFSNGGVWFFAIDTEESLAAGSEQTTWLEQALADASHAPGFRFSVVYMHRPLYTLGDAAPQLAERQVLEPIFVANGVALVLAGHMHGYERFETPSGITYVTCAGGGGVINDVNANLNNYPDDKPLRVAVSDHYSACLYTIAPGRVSSTVIDEFGATIDQFDKAVP
jgi:hypothetical protein